MNSVVLRRPQQMRHFRLLSCILLGLVSIAVAWGSWQGIGPRTADPDPLTLTFDSDLTPVPEHTLVAVSFTLPESSATGLVEAVEAFEPGPTTADLVLRAIAQVESRGNPACVGRMGERGLYQFRRSTWRQHTREDFRRAHHPEISTLVAMRHYEWIVRSLRAHGRPGTPYEVALAWNAGLSRVLSGKIPSGSRHYAQRVANLVSQS